MIIKASLGLRPAAAAYQYKPQTRLELLAGTAVLTMKKITSLGYKSVMPTIKNITVWIQTSSEILKNPILKS